jgi:hypothetical protein
MLAFIMNTSYVWENNMYILDDVIDEQAPNSTLKIFWTVLSSLLNQGLHPLSHPKTLPPFFKRQFDKNKPASLNKKIIFSYLMKHPT